MLRFAFTIFLSAFLLFQIQPIIARFILPWYGGTSTVWTVCLVFFQLVLLAGYTYAHTIRLYLRPFHQVVLHLILLSSALLLLPIAPDTSLKPEVETSPLTGILLLLTATVGIPYFLISASGPLLQHWYKLRFPEFSPYRLYSLSNIGSLLGLLIYPFLVEPLMTLSAQSLFWSIGFFLLAISTISCAWHFILSGNTHENLDRSSPSTLISPKPKRSDHLLWIGLSACASALLIATTNQVCQDIASVPFLWLLPLSLYLISFIVCFDHARWYDRRLWLPLLFISILFGLYAILVGAKTSILFQILTYNIILFSACMNCHGEMVRLKPHPERLTGFYLSIALGGVLGGIFVSLVAPKLFSGYWELQLLWCAIFVLLGICLFREKNVKQYWFNLSLQMAWGILCGTIALVSLGHILNWDGEILYKHRNFYGVLRIKEYPPTEDYPLQERVLMNGGIWHGNQVINDKNTRRWPTSYYGHNSGIGLTLRHHPKRRNNETLHIGVVGMGIGTIAALGKQNDIIRFYEINPQVIETSQEYFTFLDDSLAQWQAVSGDARISLENELNRGNRQNFDVLAIDAFSGDAIPVHLLTLEAFELYDKHLNDNGIIAVHISNRHLNLSPPILSAARHLDKQTATITNEDNSKTSTLESEWILLTDNKEFLEYGEFKKKAQTRKIQKTAKPWTDDYSNLLSILKL